MSKDPVDPPDITEDLERLAEERIARLRHANRIRAVHKVARSAGVDLRNAEKLRRQANPETGQ